MIDTAYIDNIQKFRRERDARIKANPLTWLALVGLFPLEEGDNPFGGRETGGIYLAGLPREQCGSFVLKDGKVSVTAATGSSITVNGEAATDQWLKTDKDGKPDLIEIGTLAIKIIQRGCRSLFTCLGPRISELEKLPGIQILSGETGVLHHRRLHPLRFTQGDQGPGRDRQYERWPFSRRSAFYGEWNGM